MKNNPVTLPAGEYFIGDPCYAIPYDSFRDYWNDALFASDYFNKEGIYYLNGEPFVGYSTYYGDGVYTGTDGYDYGVDAGLIGVVSMGLVMKINTNDDYTRLGTIVTFTTPFECFSTTDGRIHIGHIMIDTNPSSDEELDTEEDACDEADRLYYEALREEDSYEI